MAFRVATNRHARPLPVKGRAGCAPAGETADSRSAMLQPGRIRTWKELDFCHERVLREAKVGNPDVPVLHGSLRSEHFWLARSVRGSDTPGLGVTSG